MSEVTNHCHFLAGVLSECFGPLHLPRVSLPVEVPMAFRSAEFEGLRIIADECDTMAWVDRTGAEITIAYSHLIELYNIAIDLILQSSSISATMNKQ